MWKGFWKKAKGPKGRNGVDTGTQAESNVYVHRYEDTKDMNLTAILANKAANLAVSDMAMAVVGDAERAAFLNDALKRFAPKLKMAVNRMLGIGGVVLKPYFAADGKIYTDVVPQNRMFILERCGDIVTSAEFMAEAFVQDKQTFVRTERHTLSPEGTLTITQKATADGEAVPVGAVPEWARLSGEVVIENAGQMLFAFLKCPTDNRKSDMSAAGVPLTYGCEKLMAETVALLSELQKEVMNKGVFVGVSDLLFGKDDELPENGIFKKLKTDSDDFFQVFSPDMRVRSYVDAVNYKMELLEKSVGMNKGVLTDLATADATATAIKRSSRDTYAFISAVRTTLEAGISELVGAYSVLADAYGLAPVGDYRVTFDWSYDLLEDSQQSYNQLLSGVSAGAAGPEELRMWLFNEDRETALRNLPKNKTKLEEVE